MKASELRAKDVAGAREGDRRPAEGPLRPAHAEGHPGLANHSQLGKTRRDIARAKTILAEKKKGAAK
jgi:large subunit ribosomal protein L29